MKTIIVYSIVISVCISAFAFMLVLAQPQTMPAYAPVNTNAFNPWAASQPQLQNYIPQASYAPNMPNNMMNAPNNFVNVPNNLAFPTNPNINPMINNPNLMNPNTNPNMMIPNNNPNMMIPNSNPQFQYSGQPQINPMQQPVANGFSYNAPSNEYITQQFRAPSRPQRPQFSFPQFGTNAISGPSISSSAPSFPQMDPSILNSMADTIAPSLSRGAATLESIPSTIMSQAQDQLAQSAAAAGMSTEQAQGIIQEAMQRGASILTPPRPKPSSCDKADFECQFYSACYSCYANRNQPQCMYCLNLDNCAGDLACQTQRACPVCQRLPKTETRPGACDILKC